MKTVKDCGAKANDNVNDTDAIQKADKEGRAIFPKFVLVPITIGSNEDGFMTSI